MSYPSNDDPDLNKAYKDRGDKPAGGRKDAHRDQTPRNVTPQRPSQEDQRLLEEGETQGWEQRGPEGEGADQAGAAGKPEWARKQRPR